MSKLLSWNQLPIDLLFHLLFVSPYSELRMSESGISELEMSELENV